MARSTLHEAILRLLYEAGGSLTAQQIADQINGRGLYKRAGGWPISARDVRTRVRQYGLFFTISEAEGQQTISISAVGERWLRLGQ